MLNLQGPQKVKLGDGGGDQKVVIGKGPQKVKLGDGGGDQKVVIGKGPQKVGGEATR